MDPELRVVQTPAIFFKLMSESSIDFDYIQKFVIKLQSRSMPNPALSDNDFKNKMAWVWTTLKLSHEKWKQKRSRMSGS